MLSSRDSIRNAAACMLVCTSCASEEWENRGEIGIAQFAFDVRTRQTLKSGAPLAVFVDIFYHRVCHFFQLIRHIYELKARLI